jgi:hypothetical protein
MLLLLPQSDLHLDAIVRRARGAGMSETRTETEIEIETDFVIGIGIEGGSRTERVSPGPLLRGQTPPRLSLLMLPPLLVVLLLDPHEAQWAHVALRRVYHHGPSHLYLWLRRRRVEHLPLLLRLPHYRFRHRRNITRALLLLSLLLRMSRRDHHDVDTRTRAVLPPRAPPPEPGPVQGRVPGLGWEEHR